MPQHGRSRRRSQMERAAALPQASTARLAKSVTAWREDWSLFVSPATNDNANRPLFGAAIKPLDTQRAPRLLDLPPDASQTLGLWPTSICILILALTKKKPS